MKKSFNLNCQIERNNHFLSPENDVFCHYTKITTKIGQNELFYGYRLKNIDSN